MSYGISVRFTNKQGRSASAFVSLGAIRETYRDLLLPVPASLTRLEKEGMSYSNQDFDVLSNALDGITNLKFKQELFESNQC